MHEKKLDWQINKLKALEKLQKELNVAAMNYDFERAIKLRDQLKHEQAVYDAEFKSVTTTDNINN